MHHPSVKAVAADRIRKMSVWLLKTHRYCEVLLAVHNTFRARGNHANRHVQRQKPRKKPEENEEGSVTAVTSVATAGRNQHQRAKLASAKKSISREKRNVIDYIMLQRIQTLLRKYEPSL